MRGIAAMLADDIHICGIGLFCKPPGSPFQCLGNLNRCLGIFWRINLSPLIPPCCFNEIDIDDLRRAGMIVSAFGGNRITSAKAHHFRSNAASHVLKSDYLDRQIADQRRPDPLQRIAASTEDIDTNTQFRLHKLDDELAGRTMRVSMADHEHRSEGRRQSVEPRCDDIDVIESSLTAELWSESRFQRHPTRDGIIQSGCIQLREGFVDPFGVSHFQKRIKSEAHRHSRVTAFFNR